MHAPAPMRSRSCHRANSAWPGWKAAPFRFSSGMLLSKTTPNRVAFFWLADREAGKASAYPGSRETRNHVRERAHTFFRRELENQAGIG